MNPRTRLHWPIAASLRARPVRLFVLLGVTCALMLIAASSAFAAPKPPPTPVTGSAFPLPGSTFEAGDAGSATAATAEGVTVSGNRDWGQRSPFGSTAW